MSGIGAKYPTYEPLRQALEAHAKEAYGDEYVLQDFVIVGYVVSMEDTVDDRCEYIMATSTGVSHIVDGLLAQSHLFRESDDEDGDE